MLSLDVFQTELKKIVKGQDNACDVISTSIYKYLLKRHGRDHGIFFNTSSTLLLIGSTGCGKTFLVNQASELLGIPILEIQSKEISQGGSWHGESLKKLIEKHQTFGRGIIYIDEFDKIVQPLQNDGQNYNQTIQNSILKVIEGISLETFVDTSQFLFIFSGAFIDLQLTSTQIGFGNQSENKHLEQALIEYGMLPELLGRIQEICILNDCTTEMYQEILESPSSNLIKYCALLNKLGLFIEYDSNDLIKEAERSNLGVRGLSRAIENIVTKTINQNQQEMDLEKFSPLYTKKY